ncbi:MAG: hypothetical protein M9894_08680 [Planctomycetes bacterium]|nr:hypothetical protein [Planctomycetota bacterium]
MVRGFFRGGLIGAALLGGLVLGLYLTLSRDRDAGEAVFIFICAGVMGLGFGGPIGVVRALGPRWRFGRKPAAAPQGEALRLRLVVSALYAFTLSALPTIVLLLSFGRGGVTHLVDGLVPFDVTPLHARAMVAGTIFLAAFAVIAGLSVRRAAPAPGLGRAEQRLLPAAGFASGLLGVVWMLVVAAGP